MRDRVAPEARGKLSALRALTGRIGRGAAVRVGLLSHTTGDERRSTAPAAAEVEPQRIAPDADRPNVIPGNHLAQGGKGNP